MTVNLHARDDFEKGDIGYAIGHRGSRATEPRTPPGSNVVTDPLPAVCESRHSRV